MDRPTAADQPLRLAFVSLKGIAVALLVVAAAFAPADRTADLQQVVAQTLDHDRAGTGADAGLTSLTTKPGPITVEPTATPEPAGVAGSAPTPKPLPPTDTAP